MPEDVMWRIAADLAGTRPVAMTPARPGGNNRIFKLVTEDGVRHALKVYPQQSEDPRDRLGVEFAALSFLSGNGITQVPRPRAIDRDRHCALYEWIDGSAPPVDDTAVDSLAAFLLILQDVASRNGAERLPAASAACPSAALLTAQLDDRRRRLEAATVDPDLAALLSRDFDPLATVLKARAARGYQEAGLDFAAVLPRSRQVLSPSDFGFHNALAGPDGRLTFIDFEYFGWDDPVKVAADVGLHAGMELDRAQARRFLAIISPAFSAIDEHFVVRLRLLYPLFSLVWVLIILNEFLPERWARRVLAAGGGDLMAARTRQLAKAARRLAMLKENHDACPL